MMKSKAGAPWIRNDLLVAFRLYCNTPFGRLHQHNPEIIELAKHLQRTPSAIAMKACNFASLDPHLQARHIKALGNVGKKDRELWEEFSVNSESVSFEAETAYENVMRDLPKQLHIREEPLVAYETTETLKMRKERCVQTFFRKAVLASYNHQCAITKLGVVGLLNASHIIPWKDSVERRADPRNGIALNTLHDRAFDRGYITFDESFRLTVAREIKTRKDSPFLKEALVAFEGEKLRLPYRFQPDPEAMAYHRENIFIG